MSVSLEEVLSAAGYDVRNNPEDAKWFLSQKSEIDDLEYDAEKCSDDYDEYEEYLDEYIGDNPLKFEEWRETK